MIIYIKFYWQSFSILELIQNKIEEIKTEYNEIIKGPKYFFIDYFELNNMNSIGIGANDSFLFDEQEKSFITSISTRGYQNYYITKTNNLAPQIFKSIIIYINSTNNILFEVKKYNYSIFKADIDSKPDFEYFQLCQGNNSLNELYFWITANIVDDGEDLFTSVFGHFDSFYIKEEEIKNLSDFDFDKIKENNFYQAYNESGYLKIKCNSPLMLKHTFLNYDYDKILNASRRYYLNNGYIRRVNYTFDNTLINKNLQLKFTIFGLKQNEIINLIFNNNIYELNNTPFEVNFTYKEYISDLLYFKVGEEIGYLAAEIIVGFLPEHINEIYRQIDFTDSFGTITLEEKKGVIIKIPKDLNEDLYDFSIIFPGGDHTHTYSNTFEVQIAYDKIEFLSIYEKRYINDIFPIIPLFRVNPYDEIKKYSSIENNKYIYILIYNYYYYQKNILIKKPMLYENVKLNKLNVLPKLSAKNK